MARVKSVSPRKPITNPNTTFAINANRPRAAKKNTNRALAEATKSVKTVKLHTNTIMLASMNVLERTAIEALFMLSILCDPIN